MTERSTLAGVLFALGSFVATTPAFAADAPTPAVAPESPATPSAPSTGNPAASDTASAAAPAKADDQGDDKDEEADDDEPGDPEGDEKAEKLKKTAPPAAAISAAPRPPAPERPDTNSIDDGQLGTHQSHFLVSVGWRQGFVSNEGLDPFSENNAVPQVSFAVGRSVLTSGNLSLAGLLLWDYGGLESTARGAKTSLELHRLTLGAEGRYHLWRRLYVFGRLAPGALYSGATLADATAGVDQKSSAWVFAADLSAGAAFEFAGDNRGASTRPRAWLGFDAGYGWAAASSLDFKPENPDQAPVRLQPLSFGDLAVRGPFLRVSAVGTY